MRFSILPAVLAVVVTTVAARGEAPPQAGNKAAAEALFEEGRKLLAAGKFAEACAKLAASQAQDPAAGTLLNLAGCFEKNGQTASAWSTFKDAEKASLARGKDDWVRLAREHIAALTPKLVRLRINVPGGSQAGGLSIKRDGAPIEKGEWGASIPVDPGDHKVEATAPGRRTWVGEIALKPDAGDKTVDVPPLEEVPPGETATPIVTVVVTKTTSPQRTVGFVVGGVGVAGLAFGVVGAIVALGKRSDASSHCTAYPDHCAPDHSADGPNGEAQSWATVSTIAIVGGGVLAATGAALVLTAPKSEAFEKIAQFENRPTLTSWIRPTLSPTAGGCTAGLLGAF